jgi:alpha-glucan phosphorylase-like protein
MIGQLQDSNIKLKRIFIESRLPEALAPLQALAHNIWWSWNAEATALFHTIDTERFKELNYSPIALLDDLSGERTQELLADKAFMERLARVEKEFAAYVKEKPDTKSPKIAYFSMEFGLHISLRLYSGGLGVLAGDYLKEASDANSNLVAVGLLYRYGYFQQSISLNGDQINNYPPQQFTKMPIHPVRDASGEWLKIRINLKERVVFAKVWELKVGRIPLYLLDTDIDENSWEDRSLTHQLYGGDNEHRLKQEILLGIGGIRVLEAMGIQADVYHCNEGHAAFMSLERLRNYVNHDRLHIDEAIELVRASSLFTTHTPVPAGHDYFPEALLKPYFYEYIQDLGIHWERLMAWGKIDPTDPGELFSMSHLAIRMSQEINGVSKLHGEVSRKMFNSLFPGYIPEELHIGHVTNSVHYPTWIAPEWHDLYEETFGKKFLRDQYNHAHWRLIHKVSDERIMAIRRGLKQKLIRYVKQKMQDDLTRRGENPRAIFEVLNHIAEDVLVIGFARRFATYKRAQLLFSNIERLAEIVNDAKRPVLFIYAGKAHPADSGGKELIRQIVHISKRPEFAGKVLFLEDYNMEIAKLMVQGVDIWLNTPTRPMEASGTSGMKAVLNGVLNFSVLDGWWAEGYRPDAGWALPLEDTYTEPHLQNELDAETLYNILENEIVPTYYDTDEKGISTRWVQFIKNNIAEIAPEFTMQRMLDDYYSRFYHKLAQRFRQLKQANNSRAIEISAWKSQFQKQWPQIELADIDAFDTDNHALPMGKPFYAKLHLRVDGLNPQEIGVEIVFFKRINDDELEIRMIQELAFAGEARHVATYTCEVDPHMTGVYEYGFRVFPKKEWLAHRQDFLLVQWL